MPLSHQSYTFDPREHGYPFLTTANRYWDPSSPWLSDSDALTLIFTHATGFHKEEWEATIEDLYQAVGNSLKIREAWSIDGPNHGDAAILNESALQWGFETVFGWEEYGRTVHGFLAGLGTGVDVDFSTRRLVGIGHSMGAVAIMLSTTYYPPIKYASCILVEPMVMAQRFLVRPSNFLVDSAVKRRDIWPSSEEALKLFRSRPAYQTWDARVLEAYVEHALRPLPTADYPDKTEGVTLKCSKIQEAACYRDSVGIARAYRMLSTFVKRYPVHIIYGAVDDYVARNIKDDFTNNASGGVDKLASLRRVESAGHLISQTKPRLLAESIRDALLSHPSTSTPTTAAARARL